MLTGKEYLESIRDGRKVYIGKELVEDITTHPAFAKGAETIAMIYDRKAAPENRDVMVSEEDGEEFSTYFLKPKSRDDLEKRRTKRTAGLPPGRMALWGARRTTSQAI